MTINQDNREETEREFLALILKQNEVLKTTPIRSEYLKDKENSKLYSYFQESYKNYGTIDITKIVEKHQDFNFDLYLELLDETIVYSDWENHIGIYEENIVKYYKQDILGGLSTDLSNNKIKYEDFIAKVKKLDEINVFGTKEGNNMLNISDIDMSQEEQLTYVSSNTTELDNAVKGFALGQLSVWSGSNGGAKSTYLNQLAIESINQGYKVAIYSGELVAKRLLKWIVMQSAGKRNMSFNQTQNYWYVNSYAKQKILKWLNNKLFIYNNEKGNKAKEIIQTIKDCVKKQGVKIVILDNLMSMNLTSYGENKYDVQSVFVQELSAIAKELDVHIHFVCHPRKATSFLRKTDISGSADLSNIADNVFIMHRVNNDFKIKTQEMFKWGEDNPIYQFSNVVEVCKNRDFGVQDCFVGMYFELESKRMLNTQNEDRRYKWVNEII